MTTTRTDLKQCACGNHPVEKHSHEWVLIECPDPNCIGHLGWYNGQVHTTLSERLWGKLAGVRYL